MHTKFRRYETVRLIFNATFVMTRLCRVRCITTSLVWSFPLPNFRRSGRILTFYSNCIQYVFLCKEDCSHFKLWDTPSIDYA
jgi:hypothetical protein